MRPQEKHRSQEFKAAGAFADAAQAYVAQADRLLPQEAGGAVRRNREVLRLACDLAIADRIEANPGLLQAAFDNLDRWLRRRGGGEEPPALAEWRVLLGIPLQALLGLMRGADENAMRLRRSTPFCGILSQWERRHLHAQAGFGAYPAR